MNSFGNLGFDRVQVINLQRDAERLQSFRQRLPSDWPFERPQVFQAIDGSLAPLPDWWPVQASAWGCFLSHLRVLENALNDGVDSILVMEDDAVFVNNFTQRLKPFADELPIDWDWVYLGGQHIRKTEGIPCRTGDNLYRPHNVHRSHCYGFQGRKVMEHVYRHLNSPEHWSEGNHVDHRFGELHRDFTGGVFVPPRWLIGQAGGFSNIKKRDLEENFFPDTVDVVSPVVDARMFAVVGFDSATRNLVAAMLHILGVSMGGNPPEAHDRPWDIGGSVCAPALTDLCTALYSEPWWVEKTNFEHRRALLAGWASRRTTATKDDLKIAGGTHPTFCIMARELCEAWNQPTVVIVSPRPDSLRDEATARRSKLEQLRNGIGEFEALSFREIVRVNFNELSDANRLIKRFQTVIGGECPQSQSGKARKIIESFLSSIGGR
jgi:hypothetical protein